MTTGERFQLRTAGWPSYSGANGAGVQAILAGVLLAAAVLGLWLLSNPYEGVVHDARLYVGHVLAAADPQGVGQDIMFRKDGQFGFSLFPALLAAVIDVAGVSLGAKLVSLAGLLVWIAAMGTLAFAMAEGRVRWAILVFVVVLPTGYGAYGVFNYSEPMATPRVFAEAGVLFALALLCRGQTWLALLPLLAAGLLHPIMALPGFGVWAWFVFFDPRERLFPLALGILCAVAGLTLAGLAAAFHMPVFERLFVGIDPDFREMLSVRARHLFPGFWPWGDWSRLAVQAATLAVAAVLVSPRVRSLFVGGLAAGLGGVAASILAGDMGNSLLAVQAQLWRGSWLVAVLAAAALAICAVTLWRQGAHARVTLGLLIVAWLGADHPVIGFSAALLALVFAIVPSARRLKFQPQLVLALWSFVALYALLRLGMSVYAWMLFLHGRPEAEGGESAVQLLGTLGVWTIPICAAAVAWALSKRSGPAPIPIAAGLAIVLMALAVVYWDTRTPRTMAADSVAGDPALKALLSTRDGDVLWLDGRFETWSFAGRPNWASAMQGAGGVFSRPLALEWDRRVRILIDLGLTQEELRNIFTAANRSSTTPAHLANLNDARLERLCGLPDAPAWLIAPAWAVADGDLSAKRWRPANWTAPGAVHSFTWDGGAVDWISTQDYAVIACAS
jgi:hypothetical protein